MEIIIQQIAIKLVTTWPETISATNSFNLDEIRPELLKINNDSALELLSSLAQEIDVSFFESKDSRKELCLVSHKRNRKREQLTDLGWFVYERSYYPDSGKRLYPVDVVLGIESYERIGPNVCAALLNNAASVSMRASALIVTNGDLSAQSVCNKVH
jgi:hypothetical protein